MERYLFGDGVCTSNRHMQTVSPAAAAISRKHEYVDTVYVRTYYVRMNVTLSVDAETLRRARITARSLGKSVNQLVRDYLEQLAFGDSTDADIKEFLDLSAAGGGRSAGRKFSRDEIHERG